MAILDSSFKTGYSWVAESVALFKIAPRKWLLLALAYVAMFMLLPSMPGLQVFSLIFILMWPVFLAVAIAMYRNADIKKQQNLSEIFTYIKPKLTPLIALGAACLLYSMLVNFALDTDIKGLLTLAQNKTQMTESQAILALQKMLPVMLKISLLLIPLLMATWFSPMLIVFNDYGLVKAIKSSIAGSLQYMLALIAAWLVLTLGIVALMLAVGIVAGVVNALMPALGQMILSFVVFGCLLLATALMLAFQYVSYRDVFRAA
jgi:hypothetical protein